MQETDSVPRNKQGLRKLLFLTLTICAALIPLVNAAPVTDLNLFLVNPPAILTKDLNFGFTWTGGDVNVLYWKFDTDGNVLVSGSDLNVIFSDDFETGGFTDDWNVVSGSWSQTGGALRTSDDGSVIYHEQQLNNLEVSFEFTGKFSGAGGTALSYAIINETTPGGTEEGYQIQILPAGDVKFNNRTNGANINRITSSETISSDTNYTVKATRASNGIWTLFLDGMEIGSAHDSNHTDFPYSSLTTNGTPTEFLFWDVNLEISEFTPITSPAYQSHIFNTGGSKTIQVTAQNEDGNASTSLDLNVFGVLNLTVWDENTGVVISGATVDFNSGTYTTDGAGQVSIPLEGIATDEYTLNIDNSSYTARDFVYDLNEFSVLDLNALLLKTSEGSSRDFTIYQPDDTTLITDSMVEWRNTSTVTNGIAQRTKTSSSGTLTFFGQTQEIASYVMRISDSVAGVERDYNGTSLQINIPRNATAITEQISPFNVDIGNLASESYTGLTANLTYGIYSDTTDFYTISVDTNAEFYPAHFLIQTRGGDASKIIQPYILPVTGNLETTVYTIDNDQGRTSLPGIRIESYTDINGTNTLVESKFSDGTGTALFHFETGKEYTLDFYEADGTFIFSRVISANSENLFVYLDTTSIVPDPQISGSVVIEWFPSLSVSEEADGNINIYQILRPRNTTIGDVNVYATSYVDTNVVFDQFFNDINTHADFNLSYSINVSDIDGNRPLTVHIQIWDTNGGLLAFESHQYSFFSDTFSGAAERLKNALGQFAVTFIGLMVALVILNRISSSLIGEDRNSLVIPAMFITGIFMFIGWIPFADWVAGVAAGIGFGLMGESK